MTAPQHDVAGAVLAIDQAMIALAVAKSALLGETSPAMLVPILGGDDPYGRTKHGRFDAASEPALCQATTGTVITGHPLICDRAAGHGGWHRSGDGPEWRELPDAASAAEGAEPGEYHPPGSCDACSQPPDLAALPAATPFPHLPHLAEHQGGRPDCIICGIDHDAAARLAPPAPYSLGAMELLNDIFTDGA